MSDAGRTREGTVGKCPSCDSADEIARQVMAAKERVVAMLEAERKLLLESRAAIEERVRWLEARLKECETAYHGQGERAEKAEERAHQAEAEREMRKAAEEEARGLREKLSRVEAAVIDVLRDLRFTGRACEEDDSWLASFVVAPLESALQEAPDTVPPTEEPE